MMGATSLATVLEAKDGLDALAVAKSHGANIHLVVTDVVMPNMSGRQMAMELTHLRPEVKLLFVSGYARKTVLDHKVFDLETNLAEAQYAEAALGKDSCRAESGCGEGSRRRALGLRRSASGFGSNDQRLATNDGFSSCIDRASTHPL